MAALTYPLSRAEFQARIRVASATFHDQEQLETSGLASGQILRADIGPQLWRGTVTLVPGYHDDVQAVEARLSILRRSGASFFISDPRRIGPRSDPEGTTLGASTVQIHTLVTGNREIRLKGLPSGYVLSEGDMLSFSYSVGSVTLYALHRLVVGATADGSGVTPAFEVTPPIRPGAAVDAAVVLVRPYCKAIMVPGSVRYGTAAPRITGGASFEFLQTLG
jgi:hypothetical protein